MRSKTVYMLFHSGRLLLVIGLLCLSAAAACSDENSPLAALVRSGTDDGTKTPLILIHGVHGTPEEAAVDQAGRTWDRFRELFDRPESGLADRYIIYLFQYCSDREPVSAIARKLRDLIDRDLVDRDHVIVAHSMGGLVATSYMAETEHLTGKWKAKKGGDTTIGLITLATPHHGSPGANSPETMKRFVPDRFEAVYLGIQRAYWRKRDDPTKPNRGDLRWDNYDGKLEAGSKDVNTALATRNRLFQPYTPKLVAYAGAVPSTFSASDLAELISGLVSPDDKTDNPHHLLTLANIGIVTALGSRFGDADGLVPETSALACSDAKKAASEKSQYFVCTSRARVRRFEPGSGEVEAAMLPAGTLSIFRSPHGFDHLDMLVNPDVLGYVVKDLQKIKPIAPIAAAGSKQ